MDHLAKLLKNHDNDNYQKYDCGDNDGDDDNDDYDDGRCEEPCNLAGCHRWHQT